MVIHTLSAYLTIRGASNAIAFYKKAFGATELMRLSMPGENPQCFSTSPEALGGSPITLHLL